MRSRWAFVQVLLLAAFAREASSQLAGATQASFDVNDSGVATYSIPITVPPGTHGVQPRLALVYTSGTGNGPLGMGWSIGGLSVVHRCPQTLAQDGVIAGVANTLNDKLCLDGERLALRTGIYGRNGSMYRTEHDQNIRVSAWGIGTGNFATRFEVDTTSGQKMVYGETADAIIEAVGTTVPRLWALSRVTDLQGNTLRISYNENTTTGEYRPTAITYTENAAVVPALASFARIEFEYSAFARPDASVAYSVGSLISSTALMTRVVVCTITTAQPTCTAATTTHEYRFVYQTGSDDKVTRMTSLTECGKNGQCLPATSFTWLSDTPGWAASTIYKVPAFVSALERVKGEFVDVNADGYVDFAYSYNGPSAPITKNTYLNGSGGFSQTASPAWATPDVLFQGPSGISQSRRFAVFADINSDGFPDVVSAYRNDNSPAVTQKTWLNQKTGFATTNDPNWTLPDLLYDYEGTKARQLAMLVDLDGDGRPDYVQAYQGYNNGLHRETHMNTGAGFGGVAANFQLPDVIWAYEAVTGGEITKQKGVIIDLNGDGLPDFVQAYRTTNQTVLNTWLNDGNTFNPAPSQYALPGPMFDLQVASKGSRRTAEFADVNGDSLPDYVMSYVGAGGGLHIATYLNTGTGWSRNSAWDTPAAGVLFDYQGTNVRQLASLTDINGDGLVDILVSYSGTNNTHIDTYLNTPTGFSTTPASTAYQTPDKIWAYPSATDNRTQAVMIDIDGDGDLDFVRSYDGDSTNFVDTRLNTTTVGARIGQIVDGLGKTISITYTPGTRTAVYTKGTGSSWPYADLISSIPLVSRFQMSDGIGGMRGVTLTYSGLVMDFLRRTPLGFAQRTQLDELKSLKRTTGFLQAFPQQGLTSSSEVRYMPTNRVLETSTSTWITDPAITPGQTYYKNLLSSQTVSKFDLNGTSSTPDLTAVMTRTYDIYANVTSEDINSQDGYRRVTTMSYSIDPNDLTNWLLGLPIQQEVRGQSPSSTLPALGQGRIVTRSYFSGTGLPQSETVEPGGAASLNLLTTYAYDGYGNATSATASGASIATRTSSSLYDATGRFVINSTNAENHSLTRSFDPATGLVLTEQGPNFGVASRTFSYDALGRPTGSVTPGGATTSVSYAGSSSSCPTSTTKLALTTTSTSGPTEVKCADLLNRVVRSVRAGFAASTWIYADVVFDAMGRPVQASRPYFSTDTPRWGTATYDVLDRELTRRQPGLSVDFTTSYGPFTVTTTNEKSQVRVETRNSRGEPIDIKDANNNHTTYQYDGYGSITRTTDPAGNQTTMIYDKLGRRTQLNDLDLGTTTDTYDALGQMLSETDARPMTTTFSYDKIGRLKQRVAPDTTATFTFDTATNGIGQPATQSGGGASFQRTFQYDVFGRPSTVTVSIDGTAYTTTPTYDSAGRMATLTYPSGYQVSQIFNAQGYLSEIQRAGTSIWKVEVMIADGQIQRERLGANLVTERAYDPNNGRVQWITTTAGTSTSVQNATYAWDAIGNLQSRSDSVVGQTETFGYENLNRLTGVSLGSTATLTIAYDSIGNITSKSGVGSYTYPTSNTSRPHAVQTTSVGSKTYQYDAVGNLTNYAGQATLTYNSFNKPATISQSSPARSGTYTYAADQQLIKRVEAATDQGITSQSWIFVGDLYEVFTRNGVVEKRHYINAANRRVAIWTDRPASTSDLRYLQTDHLGSTNVVTSDSGTVLERQSYDAFGTRRNPTTWGPPGAGGVASTVTPAFTGHQQFDIFGFTYMKARMYDPTLGRFMNADSMIESVVSTQGMNRYSYVNNNPLSAVDPDGHRSKFLERLGRAYLTATLAPIFGDLAGPSGYFTADYVAKGGDIGQAAKMLALQSATWVITVAAAVVSWWAAGPMGPGGVAAFAIGLFASIASSAAVAAINGEDIGRAVLIGAAIAIAVPLLKMATNWIFSFESAGPTFSQLSPADQEAAHNAGLTFIDANGVEQLDLEKVALIGERPAAENAEAIWKPFPSSSLKAPFGADQFGPHKLLWIWDAPYKSVPYYIMRAFSGIHDFLNHFFFYDTNGFGNIAASPLARALGSLSPWLAKVSNIFVASFGEIISLTNLAPAVPFAMANAFNLMPVQIAAGLQTATATVAATNPFQRRQ
ncbi:MAG TPA: FG-GAP-like repeat-containing protein [Myxococcota bacterium]|nr:FG-GAP-like repeat-containing protein [Myxococcota bacterium]